MRSFATALIAATLATLAGAAPVDLTNNLPAQASNPSKLLGEVTSDLVDPEPLLGALGARDNKITGVIKGIESQVSGHRARTTTPSVAVVLDDILTQIQPYTTQLSYIDSSNATVAQITSAVASIKAPIVAAVPELQALVGAEAGVILAPVGVAVGGAQLTVAQVAAAVGADVNLVLSVSGEVLAFVKTNVPDIVDDVQDALSELGDNVTDLVEGVAAVVTGLPAELDAVLDPVQGVIAELSLTRLAAILGISITL